MSSRIYCGISCGELYSYLFSWNTNKHMKYLLLFSLFALAGCTPKKAQTADEWYATTKDRILHEGAVYIEGEVKYKYNEDSTYRTTLYFTGDNLDKEIGQHRGSSKGYETLYSDNGKFELRHEYCENGTMGFEGIFYNNKAYGLSTWYHCNGKMKKQGLRFDGKEVGLWKKWDEEGKLVDSVDYKNIPPAESFPTL